MEEAFDDVALYPPSHTAVIQYDLGSYGQPWGEINIEMDHDITCGDVFWTVYDFFQARLTQAEVDYLTNDNPANELMLTQNFARRCQLAPALFDYEYRQGFKRVDCLGGFKQWGGLSLVVAPDQSWELQLHLVPPSL
ncbi:hypothetical protein BV25DRAFT_1801510 [Artomyces pyxidatus]|uniref:Uncharacterized protein n=1 Tax=Artomyces pyxidatus TaxID=48021 RepID=A0ACB8T4N7_9AGAM|nr:hypothetical protein BV25DRAFT_1801510 [Artomyces pyxidatus]